MPLTETVQDDRKTLRQPKRTRLVDEVVGSLIEYIVANDLHAGARLPSENELAEQLSVSRTVVREALRVLNAREIVRTANGRGPVVGAPEGRIFKDYFSWLLLRNPHDLRELFQLRMAIEVESAEQAARLRSEEDLDNMARLVALMSDVLSDIERFTQYDLRFHILIAEASGNTLFAMIINSIRSSIRAAIQEGMENRLNFAERRSAQAHHEKILDAIRRQDSAAARATMKAHFHDAMKALHLSDES